MRLEAAVLVGAKVQAPVALASVARLATHLEAVRPAEGLAALVEVVSCGGGRVPGSGRLLPVVSRAPSSRLSVVACVPTWCADRPFDQGLMYEASKGQRKHESRNESGHGYG